MRTGQQVIRLSAGGLKLVLSAREKSLFDNEGNESQVWDAAFTSGMTRTAERLAALGYIEPRIYTARGSVPFIRLSADGVALRERALAIIAEKQGGGERSDANQ